MLVWRVIFLEDLLAAMIAEGQLAQLNAMLIAAGIDPTELNDAIARSDPEGPDQSESRPTPANRP